MIRNFALIVLVVFLSGLGYEIEAQLFKRKVEVTTLTDEKLLEYNYAFTEATKQKIFGNYKQAAQLYLKCIKVNPNSSASFYQLSDIFLLSGDAKRAEEFAKEATRLDATNVWYFLQLAKVYQISRDTVNTIKTYEVILRKFPEQSDLAYNLALIYFEKGDYKNCLRIVDQLSVNLGVSEEILVLKYQAYSRLNNCQKVEETVLFLIEKFPDKYSYLGLLAEHYAEAGNRDKAEEYYNLFFSKDSTNSTGIVSAIEFYFQYAEFDNAFSLMDKAIASNYFSLDEKINIMVNLMRSNLEFERISPRLDSLTLNLISFYPGEPKAHAMRADFFVRVEKYDMARDELLIVTSTLKTNYIIWEQLLYIASALGDYELLFKTSTEVLDYFVDKPLVYLFNGISGIQLKLYEPALISLNKGILLVDDSHPMYLQFLIFLGDAYNSTKQFELSDEYFSKAIAKEPENVFALNNYSYYLSLREEKLDNALAMMKKVMKTESSNPTYLDTYAWVLFKLKRIDESLATLEKALKLGGDTNAEIVAHYAEVLFVAGSKDNAKTHFLKAYELGHRDEDFLLLMNSLGLEVVKEDVK